MGQGVCHTDCLCLFTGVQVSRTGVEIIDTVVMLLGTDLEKHGFEFADELHVAVDAEQCVFAEDFFLFCKGFLVLVEFDLTQIY